MKGEIKNYIGSFMLKKLCNKQKNLNDFREYKILYCFILTIECVISYVNKIIKLSTKTHYIVNHQVFTVFEIKLFIYNLWCIYNFE